MKYIKIGDVVRWREKDRDSGYNHYETSETEEITGSVITEYWEDYVKHVVVFCNNPFTGPSVRFKAVRNVTKLGGING